MFSFEVFMKLPEASLIRLKWKYPAQVVGRNICIMDFYPFKIYEGKWMEFASQHFSQNLFILKVTEVPKNLLALSFTSV